MPFQNDNVTLDGLMQSVDEENRDLYNGIEDKSQGGLWKNYMRPPLSMTSRIAEGAAKGSVNAAVDIFDTVTDMGFYAGVEIADWGLNKVGRDVDEDKVLQDIQGFRDNLTNYIRSEETDDNVVNFAMNTTESVGKFYIFYKNLAKRGLGKVASAAGAGFGEGFTDSPDKELLGIDKALRLGVEQLAPDQLNNYDKAMNPETGNAAAEQMMRRVMSGVEISALSVAGEKIVDGAKAGGATAIKALPEPMKRKMVESFGKVMHRTRKAKEWVTGGQKGTFDQYVENNTVHQAEFNFTQGAMSPDKSFKDNLRESVQIEYDSSFRVLTPDDFSKSLTDYEEKLASLAPKINEEIVSMAKSRGIAVDEQLSKFARDLGMEETALVNEEGLKNVLRGQAHNVMFEQQATSFAVSRANFTRGMITEDEYLESAKSFYNTAQQRAALLSSAGRTLRTGQEIPEALQAVNKDLLAQGKSLESVLEAYGSSLDDREALRMMADRAGNIMQFNHITGSDPEKVAKAMTTALKKLDPSQNNAKKRMGDFLDAVESTYQANLLSATTTLAQNTFGSGAQMFLRASEGAIEAGLASLRFGPRQAGTPTAREALIKYKTMVQGHWDAMLLTGQSTAKATKSLVTNGKFDADGMFKSRMMDVPEMTAHERNFMYRLNKEDMSAGVGSLNEAIDNNRIARNMLARPVFDIIQMQDMVTKNVAAKAHMRGRFDTALYVDDIFNIRGKTDKVDDAQKVMNKLFREGRDVLETDEITAMGINKTDAAEMSLALKEWRRRTSTEASEFGIEAAMQTPLEGGLGNVQNILQERIPLGRLIVPFFTTPVNIFNESLKRMPLIQIGEEGSLGLPIHPQFYSDFKAGGERRRSAVAKLTSGISLTEMGYQLAEAGMLTGVPHGVDERVAFDQIMQTPAGSMKVGDTSYPIAFLGPVGNILTFGANLKYHDYKMQQIQHLSEEEQNKFNDALMFNVASMMQIAREQPYAVALDQLAGLFEFDPEDETAQDKAKEYLGRMAGNLVPYSSAQRQISSHIMEEQKRANGVMEQFLQSFYQYGNHKAYDPYGDAIQESGGWLLRQQKAADDELANTLFEYADFMPRPRKFDQTVGSDGEMRPAVKIRLREDQWTEYNRIVREDVNIRGQLERFMMSPQFKANVDNNKIYMNKKEATAIYNKAYRDALEIMVAKDKDLQYAIEQERKKKLVERNVKPMLPAGAQPIEFMGGN